MFLIPHFITVSFLATHCTAPLGQTWWTLYQISRSYDETM